MVATHIRFTRCECCGQIISEFLIDQARRHQETIEKIYGIPFSVLKQQNRSVTVTEARRHYWFLLTIDSGWEYSRAGRSTGHTMHTVMYGVRIFSKLMLGTRRNASLKEIRDAWSKFASSLPNHQNQGN